jgi:hypothetical protein
MTTNSEGRAAKETVKKLVDSGAGKAMERSVSLHASLGRRKKSSIGELA